MFYYQPFSVTLYRKNNLENLFFHCNFIIVSIVTSPVQPSACYRGRIGNIQIFCRSTVAYFTILLSSLYIIYRISSIRNLCINYIALSFKMIIKSTFGYIASQDFCRTRKHPYGWYALRTDEKGATLPSLFYTSVFISTYGNTSNPFFSYT